MTKPFRNASFLLLLLICAALSFSPRPIPAQSPAVTLQGLRSSSGNAGAFPAAKFAPDGTLLLLSDQHDGIRLLRASADGSQVLREAHLGATGDSALALALDPSGNIFVTGTSTSGTLAGTSGAAFPNRADSSTNSFLARFDSNLNLVFLTFLGAGRTAAASLSATSDAVFVTGITFSSGFPVTPAGIQQSPASGSSQNGFVERFSNDGATLVYATYLTGFGGDTIPCGIAADPQDNAFIAGSTTASGFPTRNALQAFIPSPTSGFLLKLAPAGDSFLFSTFIAGTGLSSIALDATSSTVLLTGNIDPARFPLTSVSAPLSSAPTQSLLRLSADGQSLSSSLALLPSDQSFVTPGPLADAWISGSLTTPLFPSTLTPPQALGDTFLLHVNPAGHIDSLLRTGGQPANNARYASLTTRVAATALTPDAKTLALPGTITANTPSSLLASQQFDASLVQTPNSLLPSVPSALLPSPAACPSGQCTGTAATLTLAAAATSAPSLAFLFNGSGNVTLENQGTVTATDLALTASGFALSTSCGTTLAPEAQCTAILVGIGPGSLTVSASNAPSATLPIPTLTPAPDTLGLSVSELDFGIRTLASPPLSRTVTITNAGSTPQFFTSTPDGIPASAPYTFSPTTDCPATLAAAASCHLTLALILTPALTAGTPIHTAYKIGNHDLTLTAFAEVAALQLSSTILDFGTQFSGNSALRLPRFLFLSNNSDAALSHTPLLLPTDSPFTLTDDCPPLLEPHTVCRITFHYEASASPSADSLTLQLDAGQTLLLSGRTLPPASVTASAVNPSLTVSPSTLTFATPVVATSLSSTQQTVTLKNTGTSSIPLTVTLSGDFQLNNGCPSALLPGSTCALLITFAPSAPGQRQGLLSITGGSSFAPTYVSLSGTGLPLLAPNNGLIDLGQTLVGEPLLRFLSIPQSLSTLTVQSSDPAFTLVLVPATSTANDPPPPSAFHASTTSACNNCSLAVQFLSGTPGLQTVTLSFTSTSGGNPYTVTLSATSLPVTGLLLTPIAADLGAVPINSSTAPTLFTLTNLLPSAQTVALGHSTLTGDFTLLTYTGPGQPCTGTLSAGASCFLEILFAPSTTGLRTGTFTISTSAGPVSSNLQGYGLADPGVALNPTALIFSPTAGTAATQQTITLTNTSTSPIQVGAITSSSPAFAPTSTCTTLSPGSLCTIAVSFSPQPTLSSGTLQIPITSTLNNQLQTTFYSVPLNATYTNQDAGLAITPGEVNFGAQPTDTLSLPRQFTVTNLSSKTLSTHLVIPRNFALTSPSAACDTLSPGATCTVSLSFLPSTSSALTGTFRADATPSGNAAPFSALTYLLGYATGPASLTLASSAPPESPLSFGQVASGQTSLQRVTLTNSGASPLHIRRITSEPPFLASTTCAAPLAPASSCTIDITYAPIFETSTSYSPRADTGQLFLESDAASSPDILPLAGSATSLTSPNPASSASLSSFALSEGSLTFTSTTVGSASAPQTLTLTNTGTATLHFAPLVSPADFTSTSNCATLTPGDVCTLTITFVPGTTGSTTTRSGTLELSSDAGVALDFITLLGLSTAAPLQLSPTTLDFGTLTVGAQNTLTVTATNTSATSVALLALTATGDFSANPGTCGLSLPAGASCLLNVTFTPSAAGARTGTLSLSSSATPLPLTVALTGNALLAHLQVSPAALTFGSIAAGSRANLTFTLLNTGTAPVNNITLSLSGPNATEFSVPGPCSTLILSPNAGCTVTVSFAPASSGNKLAALTVTSSDPAGPLVLPLTGNGVAGGSFTLTANGASTAALTVKSGAPATFNLSLTPLNGFTGPVALTCAPVNPGPYTTCSLLSSTLTLGGAALASTATITTLTSAAAVQAVALALIFCAPLPWVFRRRWHTAARLSVVSLTILLCVSITSCGGSAPGTDPNLRYTPPGAYTYTVTASSLTGTQVSSTVTLKLTVQ